MLNHVSWRMRYETTLYANLIVRVGDLNLHKTSQIEPEERVGIEPVARYSVSLSEL